jgi:6,7-dimethyl-8-ribityllumazine synthase
VNEGSPTWEGRADATGLRIGIVAARFNQQVVDRLVDGAVRALTDHGAAQEAIEIAWVPGAFELPVVLRHLADAERFDVLVAIGAVIRGETPHFGFVAGAAAEGIEAVARTSGIPIGFGLLTTDDPAQAEARAGGSEGNKGAEAALAAVEVATLLREL